MSQSPRVHTPAFKAQVALAAVKGDKTFSEIASQCQVHVKLMQAWKKQMLEGVTTSMSQDFCQTDVYSEVSKSLKA